MFQLKYSIIDCVMVNENNLIKVTSLEKYMEYEVVLK